MQYSWQGDRGSPILFRCPFRGRIEAHGQSDDPVPRTARRAVLVPIQRTARHPRDFLVHPVRVVRANTAQLVCRVRLGGPEQVVMRRATISITRVESEDSCWDTIRCSEGEERRTEELRVYCHRTMFVWIPVTLLPVFPSPDSNFR